MKPSDPRIAKFSALLSDLISTGTLPCAGISFSKNTMQTAQILCAESFPYYKSVSKTSQFALHSLSKAFTSICAQRLVERGVFKWETPVGEVLLGWIDDSNTQTTLYHLASHTAGLTYGGNTNNFGREYLKAGFNKTAPIGLHGTALYQTISLLPKLYKPGDGWSYSLATDVLGWVLEEITGKPLVDLVNIEVCQPLGIPPISSTNAHSTQNPVIPVMNKTANGDFVFAKNVMADWGNQTNPSSGGGGFVGNLMQVHSLAEAFTKRSKQLLSDASWNMLVTNHIPHNGDISNAIGSKIKGRRKVGVGFGFGVATDHRNGEVSWEGAGGCMFISNIVRGESLAFVSNTIPIHSTKVWYLLREILYDFN